MAAKDKSADVKTVSTGHGLSGLGLGHGGHDSLGYGQTSLGYGQKQQLGVIGQDALSLKGLQVGSALSLDSIKGKKPAKSSATLVESAVKSYDFGDDGFVAVGGNYH